MTTRDDDAERTLSVFAMLGAMCAGKSSGEASVMPGQKFLGAMPAADNAGLTAARAASDPMFAMMRSTFIHGYVEAVSKGDLITRADGTVVSFTLRGFAR